MTSSSEGLRNYTVEPEGTSVEIANGKLLPVVGSGQLEIVAEQPGGPTTIPLGKVLHVPELGRNLISERQASMMTGLLFVKSPTVAHLGTGDDACCFFNYVPSSGLYEMVARRSEAVVKRALVARAPPRRDVMQVHRLLAHPSEHITRKTAKAAGISLTGEWGPCVECDLSKAHRHAVP